MVSWKLGHRNWILEGNSSVPSAQVPSAWPSSHLLVTNSSCEHRMVGGGEEGTVGTATSALSARRLSRGRFCAEEATLHRDPN